MAPRKKPAAKKTLNIGTVVPTGPVAVPKPRKSDVELIVDALDEINRTLSYRLEMIEDNVNYIGQAVVFGLSDIDRAIRGEERVER